MLFLREGCRRALATNGDASCVLRAGLVEALLPEACLVDLERWSFETAGSDWAEGALAAIM